MDIKKARDEAMTSQIGADELNAINQFAKTELTAEQIYTFSVKLCDNEVDRDYERFDESALSVLGDLFIGKSGIFDHEWTAQGQAARIYRTEVVRQPAQKTAAGDGYCYLKGWAYLLRHEKNQSLIEEIEGGIKKEVSIGCSVKQSVCSICGAKTGTCEHRKGGMYGGKLCFAELREPTDAYEWSFVAVPAQRAAGVMKHFHETEGANSEPTAEWKTLQKQAELGRQYLRELRSDVVRLALLSNHSLDGAVYKGMVEKLDEPELQELKRAYSRRTRTWLTGRPQLQECEDKKLENEDAFCV